EHHCGYLPGLPRWDDCPSGGHGVDAATMEIPQAVRTNDGQTEPAQLERGQTTLRHSYGAAITALGIMLVLLMAATLGFLKMRDIL
ncbi:MAG: hypothetical protein ABSC65_27550, partial [Acidobacteriaceae bacterium]